MKFNKITLSANISTIRDFIGRFKRKNTPIMRVPEIEERIFVNGIKFRIYDSDDETFKAIKDDHIEGLAEKHKPV